MRKQLNSNQMEAKKKSQITKIITHTHKQTARDEG